MVKIVGKVLGCLLQDQGKLPASSGDTPDLFPSYITYSNILHYGLRHISCMFAMRFVLHSYQAAKQADHSHHYCTCIVIMHRSHWLATSIQDNYRPFFPSHTVLGLRMPTVIRVLSPTIDGHFLLHLRCNMQSKTVDWLPGFFPLGGGMMGAAFEIRHFFCVAKSATHFSFCVALPKFCVALFFYAQCEIIIT